MFPSNKEGKDEDRRQLVEEYGSAHPSPQGRGPVCGQVQLVPQRLFDFGTVGEESLPSVLLRVPVIESVCRSAFHVCSVPCLG